MPPRLPDAAELLSPGRKSILDGWIGPRIDANERQRLLAIGSGGRFWPDTINGPVAILWIGEHVGKWLHAATLAQAYGDDVRLRSGETRSRRRRVDCLPGSGRLPGLHTLPTIRSGLYPNNDWDVWSHKNNIIGLMTYYHYTGDPAALQACRKRWPICRSPAFPIQEKHTGGRHAWAWPRRACWSRSCCLYRATGDDRYLPLSPAIWLMRGTTLPGRPEGFGHAAKRQTGQQDGQRKSLRNAFEPGRPLRAGLRQRTGLVLYRAANATPGADQISWPNTSICTGSASNSERSSRRLRTAAPESTRRDLRNV